MRQLLVGLPRSGKTTFIGALWTLLNAPGAGTALALHRLAGNRERLELLAERWCSGVEAKRTEMQEEGWVDLHLRAVAGAEEEVTLSLPDLSGERFQGQWKDRLATAEYLEAAATCDGVLLFVHPREIVSPRNLSELNAEARELQALLAGGIVHSEEAGKPGATVVPPAAEVVYDAELAPTQLKLVDLLQILTAAAGRRRLRLGVVVSAWDLVEKALPWTPEEYLKATMPLLHQYLCANKDAFDSRVFGASCEGMDRDADGFAASVGRAPAERIKVVGPALATHDLTELLRWGGSLA